MNDALADKCSDGTYYELYSFGAYETLTASLSLGLPYIVFDDLSDAIREFDGQLVRVNWDYGPLAKHGMSDLVTDRKLASGCIAR
jgi:hypothetical protein